MAAAADLILHGGPILTMETAQPRAEAIAIAEGRIVAVGAKAHVMAHAGPATRQINLAGRRGPRGHEPGPPLQGAHR